MLFFSFFKTLVDKEVVVELKSNLSISGKLHSVDQFLNIKLQDVEVADSNKYPQLQSTRHCFIRGSVVRYVHVKPEHVDTELLQDATRREYNEVTRGTVAS